MTKREYTIRIPLPGDVLGVVMDFVGPLTPDQWDCMMAILDAMKPGLVAGLEVEPGGPAGHSETGEGGDD